MSKIVNINVNKTSTIIEMMDKGILPYDLAMIISMLGKKSLIDKMLTLPEGNNTLETGICFPKGSIFKFDITFYVVDNLFDGYIATLLKRGSVVKEWCIGPGTRLIDDRVSDYPLSNFVE